MKKNILYLVDFDGTITKKDTLNYLAKKFYPDQYDEWSRKIMSGEIEITEWLKLFEKAFEISQEDYDEELKHLEIDEHFKEFTVNKELKIVSGGFEYNINKILSQNNIYDIDVYANGLKFIDNNKIKIDMKHFNKDCKKCGVCKTNILKKYDKAYNKIIYIGDGITDICVAEYSDIVYAKKGSYLEETLAKKGIKYKSFESFAELLDSKKS
ncbi:MAG: MtnX-like HAD-IB family phosphatase [Fusobacteriota bacterium]